MRCVPALVFLVLALPCATQAAQGPDGLDFVRLAALRSVGQVALAPDGAWVAHTLSVPRRPGDEDDGPAWSELHLVSLDGTARRPLIAGEVNVSGVRFWPGGGRITYLAKRNDDEHTALWAIPIDGGESRRLLSFDTGIETYRISPDGLRVAFLAREPQAERHKQAEEKGYKQEVFEEDWRPRRLWIAPLPAWDEPAADPGHEESDEEAQAREPQALELEGSVFQLEWAPDGKRLAVTVAPTPLIDDRYMGQRIRVVDAESGETLVALNNSGKLGAFRFSPDGKRIAMISAADPNDPSEGRLILAQSSGGPEEDLLPDLLGHVRDFAWKDARTIGFLADVGAETRMEEIDVLDRKRTTRFVSGADVPLVSRLSYSADGERVAFAGESASHPPEVFAGGSGAAPPQRLTHHNPWLDEVTLSRQEVLRWTARDGLELEGILLRPLEPNGNEPAPLIMIVHGGPESHVRNGWVTSYSRPGQLAAANGYAVFYPNYRGSTGRGVAFSKLSQGDAAGKEFDDLVDAVGHLVAEGIVDKNRVGITGGSYGGYATAWCATRLTEHFRAGVMFVGISNKISKGLTTEIPLEDEMVHTRFKPWTKWQFSLERSPIYHAEKSRTALLIAAGEDDSRVHPSQSLQLYRALKLIGKTPVRYVRYPGEGHGNRRAAARDDYARRLMRWMDHFLLTDSRELPDWDLGLGQDEEEEEAEENTEP